MKLQCRLRIILAERNMKQLDLLKQMDEPISHASLSQIVQGKNLPTLITAFQIAKALNNANRRNLVRSSGLIF